MHLDHLFNALPEIDRLKEFARERDWDREIDFHGSLLVDENVLLITDERLNIQYASGNIFKMSGYRAEELVGRSPRILQGPDTQGEATLRISRAIQERMPFEEVIVNYRKNGERYKCWIKGEPILNKEGQLVNFIAYEKEVA